MPGTVEGTSIIQDGYSPYKVNGRDAGDPLKQTIQNVGNFSILYTAAALGAVGQVYLYADDGNACKQAVNRAERAQKAAERTVDEDT